jgi:hypothetical protein
MKYTRLDPDIKLKERDKKRLVRENIEFRANCNFFFLRLLSCCIYSVDFLLSLFIALLYILFLTGLFCLEDCFLSLSFSKVKEFSLGSFLGFQQHLTHYKSVDNEEWICHTCMDALKKK